jgi:hypothetical protein
MARGEKNGLSRGRRVRPLLSSGGAAANPHRAVALRRTPARPYGWYVAKFARVMPGFSPS